MDKSELRKYKHIQQIAKDTVDFLATYISDGKTELDIVKAAEGHMRSRGVSSFWYHNIGAFVLVGKRTTLSVSGKEYRPTNTKVLENDLITVDLNPEISSYWGDLARSFVVENGFIVSKPAADSTEKTRELFEGINTEKILHGELMENASPNITFEELHSRMNSLMVNLGYTNIDFKNNLGHSIEMNMDKRIYIEEGCKTKLSEVCLFTFEPHIKRKNGSFGYKHEDIYYFSDSSLRKL
jgi:Xaa-Pro aminopeptidase